MELTQQMINGLLQGSLYSLLAIGFTLIFGVLSTLNLAHGEVFMASGFIALILMTKFHIPLYVSFPLSIVLAGTLGLLVEAVSFRPMKREFHFAPLVSTIAFGIVISESVINLIGSDAKPFNAQFNLPNIELGNLLISSPQLILLSTSILSMVLLSSIMQHTSIGRSMRALAENEVAAKLLGVNIRAVIVFTFLLASSLAGIAGLLYAIRFEAVSPFIGATVGIKGLAVMIIGGLGNVYGAMIGGLLMGILEVLVIALPFGMAEYVDAVVWGALVVILLFRPSGLMGSRVQTERV
ncbi:branched-chain amino acid ABC transporter permease [Effusibacillus consociatus]|uniref:Branched-chain amino acid ABC transporter permease n=1 Tax=Effusibacillus consociatus TaxID=1117041 RepID=A0ABV9Q0B9_9BACL